MSITQEYYTQKPEFRDYYLSLPPAIRQAILAHGAPITTLGELQLVAEHFMHRE